MVLKVLGDGVLLGLAGASGNILHVGRALQWGNGLAGIGCGRRGGGVICELEQGLAGQRM